MEPVRPVRVPRPGRLLGRRVPSAVRAVRGRGPGRARAAGARGVGRDHPQPDRDGHALHAVQGRLQRQEQPAEPGVPQDLQPLRGDPGVHGRGRGGRVFARQPVPARLRGGRQDVRLRGPAGGHAGPGAQPGPRDRCHVLPARGGAAQQPAAPPRGHRRPGPPGALCVVTAWLRRVRGEPGPLLTRVLPLSNRTSSSACDCPSTRPRPPS